MGLEVYKFRTSYLRFRLYSCFLDLSMYQLYSKAKLLSLTFILKKYVEIMEKVLIMDCIPKPN